MFARARCLSSGRSASQQQEGEHTIQNLMSSPAYLWRYALYNCQALASAVLTDPTGC